MTRVVVALGLLTLLAPRLCAQGNLSTQGFGYPPGQVSTQSLGMGGATAESDALSTINDAALLSWTRSGFYLQLGPEFRTVDTPEGTDHSTTIRFPIVAGALTLGRRFTVGVSSSTLLDRSWGTQQNGFFHFTSGDSAAYSQRFTSKGAINDVRFGGAGQVTDWLRLGAAAHFFTGENNLQVQAIFVDSTFTPFQQTTNLSFSGTGVSGAIQITPTSFLSLAGSYRHGGDVKAYSGDTLISQAHIPDRYGFGLTLQPTSAVIVAARAEHQSWSNLNGLATATVSATDTWLYAGGIELAAKSLIGLPIPLRFGYVQQTLPFQVTGHDVEERDITFGTGVALSRGRARIDFSLVHADRTADLDVAEHAWLMSFGILVRP